MCRFTTLAAWILGAASAGSHLSARADSIETISRAQRPGVALYESTITVDGEPRADLTRAFADSLSAAIVRRGQLRLFSLDTVHSTAIQSQRLHLPAEETARLLRIMLEEGLDYLVQFHCVGIRGHHLMSVKKLHARTLEVVEAHQCTFTGAEQHLLRLVDEVLEKIDPLRHDTSPALPRTQSPAEYQPTPLPPEPEITIAKAVLVEKAVTSEPVPVYDPWAENLAYPPPAEDASQAPKALIYRELGTVNYVNKDWRFLVIKPLRGTYLQEQDPLHILWDEGDVYAHLRVSTVEPGGVVLDMGTTPDHHPIFKGDKVYGWAPPLALPEKR